MLIIQHKTSIMLIIIQHKISIMLMLIQTQDINNVNNNNITVVINNLVFSPTPTDCLLSAVCCRA